MTTAAWGIVLVVVALVTIVLQARRWRRGRIDGLQLAAGMVARAGFLFLGIIYAAGLVYRWPRAPLYGLVVVGIGIVLNLLAGILANISRTRASFRNGDGDVE